jgi:uracil-DNA glycosylase
MEVSCEVIALLKSLGLYELYSCISSPPIKKQITQKEGAPDESLIKAQQDLDHPLVKDLRKAIQSVESLETLYKLIREFDGCELKKSANSTVLFDGTPNSRVVLLGEAPGASEDEQGIPFCGESGRLLDLMLASIGLSRKKDVYITNTVFWRPPANRRPTNLEVELCRPMTEKHIGLIKPKVLVLVGSTALCAMLGSDKQITKMRGNYFKYINQYLDEPVIATAIFHPAYLLRQPLKKKETWFDLLKLKDMLSIDFPPLH